MALTLSYVEVLKALVDMYREKRSRVTSRELARRLGKHEVTVRNALRILRALSLVEARSGPSGGYEPTMKAYEVLQKPYMVEPDALWGGQATPLWVDGRLSEALVVDLEIVDLNDPRGARAILRVHGAAEPIRSGTRVRVGPLPYTRLIVEGQVVDMDNGSGELLVSVTRMLSIPRIAIKEVMTPSPVCVSPRATVREVAEIMFERGFRAVPVVEDGRILGLATTRLVLFSLLRGRAADPVTTATSEEYYTISKDDDIAKALRLMERHNVGRLLVLDERGDLVGIVTRTDILEALAGLLKD